MNKISLTSVGLLCGGLLGLGTSSVLAADFKTTFVFDSPLETPAVDTAIFYWSTELTSGTVTESDITNWSYELLGEGSSVYTETVISSSVVQPIGGVSRSLSDVRFNFNLDTLTINGWDNDYNVVQRDDATGVTYNIYLNQGEFRTIGYENGVSESINQVSFSQSTMEVNAVPEPLTILGAGTAIAFGTGFKRKLGKAKKKEN